MSEFFEPEDFFPLEGQLMSEASVRAARLCNDKLNAHIESLPIVTGYQHKEITGQTYFVMAENSGNPINTHRARLWGVEEIKPKVCEHKEFVNYEFRSDKGIICTCICGAKLSPNHWKEAE